MLSTSLSLSLSLSQATDLFFIYTQTANGLAIAQAVFCLSDWGGPESLGVY
jgi:hypothetical protein